MYKRIVNIIILICFSIFVIVVSKYYFSEENKIRTNRSRTAWLFTTNEDKSNLPLLKNDTDDVITYSDDIEMFKKKRKERIWESLISNKNE